MPIIRKTITRLMFLTALCVCSQLGWAAPPDDPRSSEMIDTINRDPMWIEGKKNVEKGESLIKKGNSRLEDGQKQLNKGHELIADGNEEAQKAQKKYRSFASKIGDASTPGAVENEAEKLDDIASDWEDAIDDIDDGNALVKKGNNKIEDAQSTIRKGRALVDSGKKQMEAAELAARSPADPLSKAPPGRTAAP